MDSSQSTLQKKLLIGGVGLCSFIALSLIVILCIPSLRTQIRSQIIKPERKVLSIANGNLLNNGEFVKVIKYQTLEGIVVEVLSSDESGSRSVIDRIPIKGEYDGFFDFYGQASQLAIVDVDEDGQLELVAPTFDKQLVAHLNVFKYNPASKQFEPLQE